LQFIKTLCALLCAFIILNAFCYFYSNPTVHYPTSSHATDYAWEPNTFYSGGTEGFASGRTDKLGYINYQPYETIHGLVMGSSHMEAKNVAPDDNTVAQLNFKFKDAFHFYNIGTSGHDFLRCVRNARDAIIAFQPQKFLIIETGSVEFDLDSMNSVVDGTYPYLESHSDGIIGLLQYFPFLRRLYAQWISYREIEESSERDGGGNSTTLEYSGISDMAFAEYNAALSDILELLAESADGKDIIIFFHPVIEFDNSSNMLPVVDKNKLRDFKRLCEEHSLTFIDMSDDFITAYNRDKIVPYGFSNTIPGEGHLNKYGHEMIAERLSQVIDAMEAKATE
jgi:hypothetical protein